MDRSRVATVLGEYTTPVDGFDGPGVAPETAASEGFDRLIDTLAGLLDTERAADGKPVVVGLGETTHGSRECFRLKAGLVALLVREFGVRTLALEAGVAATHRLDLCVSRDTGDPVGALFGLTQWLWRVETMRELLAWLRSFNRDRPRTDRVRVRGVDLRGIAGPAALLRSYVADAEIDPTIADGPLARLTRFEVPEEPEARSRALDAVETAVDTVEERLAANEGAYIEVTDESGFEHARHLCDVLRRTCAWHRVRHEQPGPSAAGMEQRDRQMAANVSWTVERDPNTRVAVWAHNSHVKRGSFDDGRVWTDATTMGERLANAFGARYTPLGFDLGRGAFRAVPADDASDSPARFVLRPPSTESATARFRAVDSPPWLLDIQAAAADDRLRTWFDRPQRIRRVGTVYDPETPGRQYLDTALTDFDGLLFADRSTPSRPIDTES